MKLMPPNGHGSGEVQAGGETGARGRFGHGLRDALRRARERPFGAWAAGMWTVSCLGAGAWMSAVGTERPVELPIQQPGRREIGMETIRFQHGMRDLLFAHWVLGRRSPFIKSSHSRMNLLY